MIKRQLRIQRINAVHQEYLAAQTAANLLGDEMQQDPGYGRSHGWAPKAGDDYLDNLEATYIIRLYAEFEAGLRDYWLTFRKKDSHPKMFQLLNESIPTQQFPQDVVDRADEVREYRNFLVHDIEDEPGEDIVTFSVQAAKKHLCAYTAHLDPAWK